MGKLEQTTKVGHVCTLVRMTTQTWLRLLSLGFTIASKYTWTIKNTCLYEYIITSGPPLLITKVYPKFGGLNVLTRVLNSSGQ